MLKNFYLYILQTIGSAVKGLDITSRLKRFIHRFVCAPAKWIRSGRQEMLNIYSRQQVYLGYNICLGQATENPSRACNFFSQNEFAVLLLNRYFWDGNNNLI